MPQLGRVLVGKYARATITQLIGINLWEIMHYKYRLGSKGIVLGRC